MNAPALSPGQQRLLKLLIHLSALLWLVALGIVLRWIWLGKFDGGYALMVGFVPAVFLVYVLRRVYLPNGAFPNDWESPERAERVRRWLGHGMVLVSLALVAGWVLLVTTQAGKTLDLPLLDWRTIGKMLIGYGAAIVALRAISNLYVPKRRPVSTHTPLVPPAQP